MKKITVGIDPDLIKSGVGVAVGNKLIALDSVSFPALIEYLEMVGPKENIKINLENPDAIKPLFGEKAKNSRAVREKICQDVGKCKAAGILIGELLTYHGYDVKLIAPLTGPLKMQAKKDYMYFNKITGWKGRTNSDQRDAGLIALWC